jgi:hypothetical protein
MVLRPIFEPEPPITTDYVPAWSAVERQQTAPARAWWLIAQPDHARLSGEIAAHFSAPSFPAVDAQIVHAVATHDAGWNLFESDWSRPPRVHRDGRPVSFFEIEPHTFLRAWTASIDRAQEDSPAGAYIVSQHFCWLGEFRLERAQDPPLVQELIRAFLADERQRQAELADATGVVVAHREQLTLLQFCDLLSLYLCSGSRQSVEFPQAFPSGRIRAHYDRETCVLTRSPFTRAWSATVKAHRYPDSHDRADATLAVSLR